MTRWGAKEPAAIAGASLARALTLTVFGPDLLASYRLPVQSEVIIGRAAEARVRIPHPSISRQHAKLHLGTSLFVEDLGSSNGTHVAGCRLARGERRLVALGEPVEMGSLTVIIQALEARRRDLDDTATHPIDVAAAGQRPDPEVVVQDGKLLHLHELAKRVAPSMVCVLLLGETGSGKEILAEVVHRHSPRRDQPFLRLNCAALSEHLLESELFGHEKGSFSGAIKTKAGLLEIAAGGTVFLDEIGEMPATLQAKLLRVLEERKVTRVGGLTAKAIDVRFVAATNRNLEQQIERGVFRSDLFYRLNGISLTIPPLRERVAEIAPLARLFVARATRSTRAAPPALSAEALKWLEQQPWPGNIRELKNVVECAVLLCGEGPIEPQHLRRTAATIPRPAEAAPSDGDRQRVIDALSQCAGNQTLAARLLGVSRTTLVSRILEYGLPRPRPRRRR